MNKKLIVTAFFGAVLFSGTIFCMDQENFQFQKPVGCSKRSVEKNVKLVFEQYDGNPWAIWKFLQKNLYYKEKINKLAFELLQKEKIKPCPTGGTWTTSTWHTREELTKHANLSTLGAYLTASARIGGEIMNRLHEKDEDRDTCMKESNEITSFEDLFSRDPEKLADELPMDIFMGESRLCL